MSVGPNPQSLIPNPSSTPYAPVPQNTAGGKNLTHNIRRLAVALAGIGFAVVLMFMQMGFRNALFNSTVKIVADMDADLLLINRGRGTHCRLG